MDYASPFVQLLGLATVILIGLASVAAGFLFLRVNRLGGLMMVSGGLLSLVGKALPQTIYVIVNTTSVDNVSAPVESMMYYTVWPWLAFGGGIIFSLGLVIVAFGSRGLVARIREVEAVLDSRREPRL